MYYFAYASLLNKAKMQKICPDAKPRFQAVLPNYRLTFSGWSRDLKTSTANIIPFRGERVMGGVWEISEDDLQKLDRFEDYPTTYDHVNVLVLNDLEQATKAMAYIKRRQSDFAKPSAEYLAVIRQGYHDWGIGE
ncbi:MAG: gamma-glutamylcyclotransferase [Dehalococcoidales bacterium]|nr:gamma-glutamylcyclotransferase [Dehalococcoidales bacterium]